jgi:hypothetical protein
VAAALASCQQDAELRAWFEHHCAMQNAIHVQFKAMPVPDGLQQQIVFEYRSQVLTTWWRRPAALATAAVVLLFVALGSIWLNLPRPSEQDVNFAAYRNRMVRTAVRNYGMVLETSDVPQVRAFLAQRQAHADYVLPKNLEETPTVGCGALSWQGKPVAMVCFRTGKPLPLGAKCDLFPFVIDQKDLANLPLKPETEFARAVQQKL